MKVHILVCVAKMPKDLMKIWPTHIPFCCSWLKIGQSCNSSSKKPAQAPHLILYICCIYMAIIFQEYKRIGKELTCLEVILSSSLEKIGIFCLINGLKPLVPMGYIFKVNTGVTLQNFNFFWANRGQTEAPYVQKKAWLNRARVSVTWLSSYSTYGLELTTSIKACLGS